MNKVKIKLPLFWKFTIAIVFVVAVFGSVNLFFLNSSLSDLSNKEIKNDGLSIASIIAERSIDLILYDDISSLDKMVSDIIKADSKIAYVIVTDKSGKVLAHTFEQSVPSKLMALNKLIDSAYNKEIRIKDINDPDKVIRNMTVQILGGSLGKVNIGVYEENFLNSIKSINSFFLSMVALFLFFGILGALFFSYIITFPIKKVSQMSENINLNSLETSNKKVLLKGFNNSFIHYKNKFLITDEIDVLTNKFNEMVMRLQKTYSELKNAQERLMQSEKTAAIGRLSAGIAHEINNPIAGIQNCLKRISKNPENIKQNISYIELMDDAIKKIKIVVQELLNFSRKHDLSFTDVNIKELIENVLMLTAYQLEKSRISIIKHYAKNIPVIQGSPNHLEQVLLNLLINSIDAIDELKNEKENINGKISITIGTINNFVQVEIEDNGIGLKEGNLMQIFDPFFTLKKIKQGTGLGLAVSRNIVKEHQGQLEAQKNINGGMTFIIKIPLNR
jgi:two-component system, NtrC family, sensor kinase